VLAKSVRTVLLNQSVPGVRVELPTPEKSSIVAPVGAINSAVKSLACWLSAVAELMLRSTSI